MRESLKLIKSIELINYRYLLRSKVIVWLQMNGS